MPLRKYRSVEEMEDTFWIAPGTPSHQCAVRIVMESVSFFASRRRLPQGTFKFRSIEQVSERREQWERELRFSS